MFSSFTSSTVSSSCHLPSSLKPPHVSLLPLHICDDSSSTAQNRRPEGKPSGRVKTTREKTSGCLLLMSFRPRDNQVLVKSGGRLKGGCVEAESAGASAPRGHLGAFESIRASLRLTCPSDEQLSSDSAGHKSPLRTDVPNWTRDLCLCVCV